MIALLARLRRAQRGAAIVEFALVLVPLVLFLFGGLDLGYQAYLRSVVQGALNDVARSSSLEAPGIPCSGETVEKKIDCAIRTRSDVVARNATYRISMTSFYDFSGIGRSEKLVSDNNRNGRYDAGDCFVDLNENARPVGDLNGDGQPDLLFLSEIQSPRGDGSDNELCCDARAACSTDPARA